MSSLSRLSSRARARRACRVIFSLPIVTAFALPFVTASADARPRDGDGKADYQFQMQQGRIQLAADSPEKSFIHYENALRARPDGLEALVGIAAIAADRNDRSMAEAAVARVALIQPDCDDVLLLAKKLGLDFKGTPAEAGGKPVRVSAAYLGQGSRDGSADGRGSLDTGELLEPALFHAFSFDATGRPVAIEFDVTCSAGLVLESPSPLRIRAGRLPASNEWIAVRDRRSGVEGRIPLRVVGPVERMLAFEARTPRDRAPESYAVAAGEKLHLQTLGFDGAGNRVYLRRLAWRVEHDGRDFTSYLSRPMSYGSPDYGFEPTGNVFAPPDDDPSVLGTYVVIAEEESSGKAAKIRVGVVPPGSGDTQATKNPGKVAWTAATFEDGLSQAALQSKLLLVEFQATW